MNETGLFDDVSVVRENSSILRDSVGGRVALLLYLEMTEWYQETEPGRGEVWPAFFSSSTHLLPFPSGPAAVRTDLRTLSC